MHGIKWFSWAPAGVPLIGPSRQHARALRTSSTLPTANGRGPLKGGQRRRGSTLRAGHCRHEDANLEPIAQLPDKFDQGSEEPGELGGTSENATPLREDSGEEWQPDACGTQKMCTLEARATPPQKQREGRTTIAFRGGAGPAAVKEWLERAHQLVASRSDPAHSRDKLPRDPQTRPFLVTQSLFSVATRRLLQSPVFAHKARAQHHLRETGRGPFVPAMLCLRAAVPRRP